MLYCAVKTDVSQSEKGETFFVSRFADKGDLLHGSITPWKYEPNIATFFGIFLHVHLFHGPAFAGPLSVPVLRKCIPLLFSKF